MRRAVIWDLDGTLLDSYGVIVKSLHTALMEAGVFLSREEIRTYALKYSIEKLLTNVAKEYSISLEQLHLRHRQISGTMLMQIEPMKNALQILQQLDERGVENYVYTHRGSTTVPVLDNLSMTGYFKEILTSKSGFPRKPAPDAITYLMNKYGLDAAGTYYVGDRSLDMASAKNAGIASILFRQDDSVDVSTGQETYTVTDLMQILDIVIAE